MHTYIKHILVGTLAVSFCLVLAESFVVKNPKRSTSITSLKENCCEECSTLLELFPDIMHAMATIQSIAIKTIRGYWEGDKQTMCLRTTKSQLESCCKKLTALREQMEQMKKELQQQAAFLQSLEGKA